MANDDCFTERSVCKNEQLGQVLEKLNLQDSQKFINGWKAFLP